MRCWCGIPGGFRSLWHAKAAGPDRGWDGRGGQGARGARSGRTDRGGLGDVGGQSGQSGQSRQHLKACGLHREGSVEQDVQVDGPRPVPLHGRARSTGQQPRSITLSKAKLLTIQNLDYTKPLTDQNVFRPLTGH